MRWEKKRETGGGHAPPNPGASWCLSITWIGSVLGFLYILVYLTSINEHTVINIL